MYLVKLPLIHFGQKPLVAICQITLSQFNKLLMVVS